MRRRRDVGVAAAEVDQRLAGLGRDGGDACEKRREVLLRQPFDPVGAGPHDAMLVGDAPRGSLVRATYRAGCAASVDRRCLPSQPSRRLLVCLLAMGASRARRGRARRARATALAPNGQSFPVTVDSIGSIQSPSSLDLVVYLDAQDSDPYVWVSESPAIGPAGTPRAAASASCSRSSLLPFGEQNKWVCRVSTILMAPGRTYYWWLDFRRSEPGNAFPQDRISGPFSFSLVSSRRRRRHRLRAEEPPEADPHAGVSSKTVAVGGGAAERGRVHRQPLDQAHEADAARLPDDEAVRPAAPARVRLLEPRRLGLGRGGEGDEPTRGDSELLGFWLRRQPRWLHLAPGVCTDVQGLLSTRMPNARVQARSRP